MIVLSLPLLGGAGAAAAAGPVGIVGFERGYRWEATRGPVATGPRSASAAARGCACAARTSEPALLLDAP